MKFFTLFSLVVLGFSVQAMQKAAPGQLSMEQKLAIVQKKLVLITDMLDCLFGQKVSQDPAIQQYLQLDNGVKMFKLRTKLFKISKDLGLLMTKAFERENAKEIEIVIQYIIGYSELLMRIGKTVLPMFCLLGVPDDLTVVTETIYSLHSDCITFFTALFEQSSIPQYAINTDRVSERIRILQEFMQGISEFLARSYDQCLTTPPASAK